MRSHYCGQVDAALADKEVEVAGWVHEYQRFWNTQLDEFQQHFKDQKTRKDNNL